MSGSCGTRVRRRSRHAHQAASSRNSLVSNSCTSANERSWLRVHVDMPSVFRDVDPRELRVPPSRPGGADLIKLQRQIARFGALSVGMPPLIVYEGTDGVLVVYNGVTRATRIAK